MTYRIGDWAAHPNACRLARNGTEVKLSPRSMDVLVYLAERSGRAVTHDELIVEFWRGAISSPNAIHKCIAELRHAFGNGGGEPAYIETVPRRGYRLVVRVERVSTSIGPVHNGTALAHRDGCDACVITLARRSAIVVPVDPIKRTQDETLFLESIQRELTARVAQLAEVSKVDTTTQADYRVEFDVQSAGERLRASFVVTPTLPDLPSHHQQFERASHDRFELLNDVIAQSVEVLGVLLDDRHLESMREWGTRNVHAYRDAHQGDLLRRGESFASTERAADLFSRALEKDPRFAMAYCSLAAAYHLMAMTAKDTPTREQVRQQLQALLRRATQLQIDPVALADIERQCRFVSLVNPFDAEALWRAEIIKDASNADAMRRYGDLLLGSKLIDESAAYLGRSIALTNEDCRDWVEQDEVNLAGARGEAERAIALMKRNLDRFTDHTMSTFGLVQTLAKHGRYAEAEFYLSRLVATDAPWAFFGRMMLMALRGDMHPGSNQLAHAFADPLANNTNRGFICFVLGDVEAGVRYWREIEPGFLPILWQFNVLNEGFWAPGVVDDARYRELLDELGFGGRWRAYMRARVTELTPITGIDLTTSMVDQGIA